MKRGYNKPKLGRPKRWTRKEQARLVVIFALTRLRFRAPWRKVAQLVAKDRTFFHADQATNLYQRYQEALKVVTTTDIKPFVGSYKTAYKVLWITAAKKWELPVD